MKLDELLKAAKGAGDKSYNHGFLIRALSRRLGWAVEALRGAQKTFDGPCIVDGKRVVHTDPGCTPCLVYRTIREIEEGQKNGREK